MAESTGPQRVEAITRFGADFVVPGKIIHAVGGICGAIRSQAKIMRTIEGVALALGDELGFEEISQELILATEQLEVAAQENIVNNLAAELMEAQVNAPKVIMPFRSIEHIIKEVKSLGGIIPFYMTELHAEVKAILDHITHSVKKSFNQELRQRFSRKIMEQNGIKTQVNLDLDHVVNMEYKFVRNKDLGGYEIRLSGGHLAGSCEALETSGLVTILEKKLLSNGCWEYKLENNITGYQFHKTEFLASWNEEKLIKSCWEVFEQGAEIVSKDSKHIRNGVIDNEFEMSIIVKHVNKPIGKGKSDPVCNIITARPFIEKNNI